MCEPKLRTPGIARSSRLAARTIRASSGREVPGVGHPVHQEVAFLELGEQGLTELGHHRDPCQGDHGHGGERRTGAPDDPPEDPPVDSPEAIRDRRAAPLAPGAVEEDQARAPA